MNTGGLSGTDIRIDSPQTLHDLGNGELINRYKYHYRVTAKDLGLQRYSDLTFHVEGACMTEYGWNTNSSNVRTDHYYMWNNTTLSHNMTETKYMSPGPMAFFRANLDLSTDSPTYTNTSFAILVSAVNRESFSEGRDPMYLTEPTDRGRHRVKSGRPALSCWQTDTWQHLSRNYSVTNLSGTNSSLVNFPKALQNILTQSLAVPMIVSTGQRLGASALYSATRSAVGSNFDAGGASLLTDLTYLVKASHVATKNALADTVLHSGQNASTTGIPNLVDEKDLENVAMFVIYSNDVSALSLTVLISVPIVVVLLFIIAYFVTTHRWFPWHVVQGYQATILYSLLDESAFAAESALSEQPGSLESVDKRIWKRKSIAWMKGPRIYGRHTSVVTGTDGKPTLALVGGGVDIPLHTEASVNRSVSRS
jgi:hypothetical protein